MTKGEETAGFVWFNRVTSSVIECHACVAPEFRGRWATRSIIRAIHENIVQQSGCRAIMAQIKSPLVARIWRSLGFKVYDTIAILEYKEHP